jgi:hypothetical protein
MSNFAVCLKSLRILTVAVIARYIQKMKRMLTKRVMVGVERSDEDEDEDDGDHPTLLYPSLAEVDEDEEDEEEEDGSVVSDGATMSESNAYDVPSLCPLLAPTMRITCATEADAK